MSFDKPKVFKYQIRLLSLTALSSQNIIFNQLSDSKVLCTSIKTKITSNTIIKFHCIHSRGNRLERNLLRKKRVKQTTLTIWISCCAFDTFRCASAMFDRRTSPLCDLLRTTILILCPFRLRMYTIHYRSDEWWGSVDKKSALLVNIEESHAVSIW